MPESKQSLLNRLKVAYKYVRQAQPDNEIKRSPFSALVSLNGSPQYSLTDYQAIYDSGYYENSLVYSAITYKAKCVTQAKLTAYHYTDDKGNFEPLEFGNDLQRLLDKPNPYQSGDEFQSLQNVFFNLTGNAFTYLERKGKDIINFWPLNPAFVTIIPDGKGEIMGYQYRPYYSSGEPIPIELKNMAHWKLPNPKDQLNGLGFGMSPLIAVAGVVDVDNIITRFLNVFFKNGAMPSGLLKFKDIALDQNEIDRIRAQWQSSYGGFENWSDVGILDMYADYQRIGLSFAELDFEKLDHRTETRILAALGVPLELLPTVSGLTGSTYNNKSEARQMFWQDTMSYELEVVEQELNRFFGDDEQGIFVQWDKSEVYGLRGDIQKQSDSALKLYQIGMPPRVIYQTVGLIVADYPGIDDAKIMADPNLKFQQQGAFGNNANSGKTGDSSNSSADPATDTANQDENAKNRLNFEIQRHSTEPPESKSSFDIETKKKLYKSFDQMIVSHEPDFKQASNKMFAIDRKEVLALVYQVKSTAFESKASINWLNAEQPIDNYFNNQSKDQWRKTFVPLIQGVYEDTGSFWGTQLGLQFNIRNIEGEFALDQYTLKFSDAIAQTNSDYVKEVLQRGYKEGSSIDTMTNALNILFDDWESYRSERIARTETMRAGNDGARKLYKNWGVERKEWLATGDDRTRDTHLGLDQQVKPIDEPFESSSGAKLMQPGDSDAPLAETVNCRCTVLPVLDKNTQLTDNLNIDMPPEVQEIQTNAVLDFLQDDSELQNFEDSWKPIIEGYPKSMQDAFKQYTGGGYRVNNNLRYGSPAQPSLKEMSAEMNKDFKDSLGQNIILRRGVTQDAINNLGLRDLQNINGVITQDLGYMSTSVKSGFGYDYTFQFEANENLKGAYLNHISNYDHEYEFLFAPNTKFQILDVQETQTGKYTLFARIIQ